MCVCIPNLNLRQRSLSYHELQIPQYGNFPFGENDCVAEPLLKFMICLIGEDY